MGLPTTTMTVISTDGTSGNTVSAATSRQATKPRGYYIGSRTATALLDDPTHGVWGAT